MEHEQLNRLLESCETLRESISSANLPGNYFDQQFGWNQVGLGQIELVNLIQNLISKLELYGSANIPSGFEEHISRHIENIDRLELSARTYFNANPNHLIHFVPSFIQTLLVTINDVESTLFSWANIEDKQLLPQNMRRRLSNVETKLTAFEEETVDLKKKIDLINSAYNTAEELPTVIEELREARRTLERDLKNATREIKSRADEVEQLKNQTHKYKEQSQKDSNHTERYLKEAISYTQAAKELAEQCGDYLHITTSNSLASGFEQKANELKDSILMWSGSLLVALIAGAIIGMYRVDILKDLMTDTMPTQQIVTQLLLTLFSIGGPLWLAWLSTQQINQRFKLSEDYAYKATIAKSFVGFQKIANRFDTTTEERLFNSTLDRFDEMPLRLVEGKDYNSPWHELLDSDTLKRAIEVFPELAKELSKFSSKTNLRNRKLKSNQSTKANEAEAQDTNNGLNIDEQKTA